MTRDELRTAVARASARLHALTAECHRLQARLAHTAAELDALSRQLEALRAEAAAAGEDPCPPA